MELRFRASGPASWGLAQKTTEYNSCADEVNRSVGLCTHLYVRCVSALRFGRFRFAGILASSSSRFGSSCRMLRNFWMSNYLPASQQNSPNDYNPRTLFLLSMCSVFIKPVPVITRTLVWKVIMCQTAAKPCQMSQLLFACSELCFVDTYGGTYCSTYGGTYCSTHGSTLLSHVSILLHLFQGMKFRLATSKPMCCKLFIQTGPHFVASKISHLKRRHSSQCLRRGY